MSSCLQTFTHFLPSGGETEKCDGKKKSALSFRKSWAVLKFVGYSSKAPLLL